VHQAALAPPGAYVSQFPCVDVQVPLNWQAKASTWHFPHPGHACSAGNPLVPESVHSSSLAPPGAYVSQFPYDDFQVPLIWQAGRAFKIMFLAAPAIQQAAPSKSKFEIVAMATTARGFVSSQLIRILPATSTFHPEPFTSPTLSLPSALKMQVEDMTEVSSDTF
jgi:hypothetical protein